MPIWGTIMDFLELLLPQIIQWIIPCRVYISKRVIKDIGVTIERLGVAKSGTTISALTNLPNPGE
jgi:hypothetical protein